LWMFDQRPPSHLKRDWPFRAMACNGIYLVNGKLTFVMADLRQIAITEGCLEVKAYVNRLRVCQKTRVVWDSEKTLRESPELTPA
jgi:hypothetical protein